MTDIMKLADDYATEAAKYTAPNASLVDTILTRAALQSAIEALQGEVERLKADYLEIESLCDATYVAKGADAYNHACDEMERFQDQRRKAGKEVGTERSLCDGIAWLYRHVSDVEAERDALQAKLDAAPKALAPLTDEQKDAARWQWLSQHIQVAWDEGKFTSLVRIVSNKNKQDLNASIDRMMAGDWSDAEAAHGIGGTP